MSKAAKKRRKQQKLFETLSINLAYYTSCYLEEAIEKQFACPFCLRIFNSIDALSDAHIFPKALGGRTVTLACKECNNTIGSQIESHGVKSVNFEKSLSDYRDPPLRVYLRSNVENNDQHDYRRVSSEMRLVRSRSRTHMYFTPLEKHANPEILDSIQQAWGQDGQSINIQFPTTGNWQRAKLTYLQSAYLFLFSQLGYEWIYEPCTIAIREQIQKPDEHILDFDPLQLSGCDTDKLFGDSGLSWYLVSEPQESRGYLIIFPPRYKCRPAVWMPLYDRPYKLSAPLTCDSLEPLPIYTSHLDKHEYMNRGFYIYKNRFRAQTQ